MNSNRFAQEKKPLERGGPFVYFFSSLRPRLQPRPAKIGQPDPVPKPVRARIPVPVPVRAQVRVPVPVRAQAPKQRFLPDSTAQKPPAPAIRQRHQRFRKPRRRPEQQKRNRLQRPAKQARLRARLRSPVGAIQPERDRMQERDRKPVPAFHQHYRSSRSPVWPARPGPLPLKARH